MATWTSLSERALYLQERLQALEHAAPGAIKILRTRSDLTALWRARNAGADILGALLAVESSHALDAELHNVDRLFNAGYRIMGITHFFDNELGGSLHGMTQGGLTGFGRSAVERMLELGIIIDIAHASPSVVDELLVLNPRPMVLSHGGTSRNCPGPRNLSDKQMRRFADAGGLLGLAFFEGALCDTSIIGIVKALRDAVSIMGIDQVALGSDFDGGVTTVFDSSEIIVLIDAMQKDGFTDDEIRKITSGNAMRFFQQQLPPDPVGQTENPDPTELPKRGQPVYLSTTPVPVSALLKPRVRRASEMPQVLIHSSLNHRCCRPGSRDHRARASDQNRSPPRARESAHPPRETAACARQPREPRTSAETGRPR